MGNFDKNVTKRTTKGSVLTHNELDTNFEAIEQIQAKALDTGSNTIIGTQFITGSQDYLSGSVSTPLAVRVSGSILPEADDVFDLGSPTRQFRHLHVGSGSIKFAGGQTLRTDDVKDLREGTLSSRRDGVRRPGTMDAGLIRGLTFGTTLDADTFISMNQADRIRMRAGGVDFLDARESLSDTLILGADNDTWITTLASTVSASRDLWVSGSQTVVGNLTVRGNAVVNGNLTLGNQDTDSVSFGADINSHLIPNTDDTYTLGNPSHSWDDAYIGTELHMKGHNYYTGDSGSIWTRWGDGDTSYWKKRQITFEASPVIYGQSWYATHINNNVSASGFIVASADISSSEGNLIAGGGVLHLGPNGWNNNYIKAEGAGNVIKVYGMEQYQGASFRATKFMSRVSASHYYASGKYYGDGSELTGISASLSADSNPTLNNNLNLNGNSIVGTGDIEIEGDLNLHHPTSNIYIGQSQYNYNGSRLHNRQGNLYWGNIDLSSTGSGIVNVEADTSPTLGGNLSTNNHNISGSGDLYIHNVYYNSGSNTNLKNKIDTMDTQISGTLSETAQISSVTASLVNKTQDQSYVGGGWGGNFTKFGSISGSWISASHDMWVGDDIYIGDKIIYGSDTDTYINWNSNEIEFTAGGVELLKIDTDGTDSVIVNPDSNHQVDFRVKSYYGANDVLRAYNNGKVAINSGYPSGLSLQVGGDTRISGSNTVLRADGIISGSMLHLYPTSNNNSDVVLDANGSGSITHLDVYDMEVSTNIKHKSDNDTKISFSTNRVNIETAGIQQVSYVGNSTTQWKPVEFVSGTTFYKPINLTDTTDATDASGDTGALMVEGGVSIAKKAYVGTDLSVGGDISSSNGTGSFGKVVSNGHMRTEGTNPYFIAQESTSEFLKMGVDGISGDMQIGCAGGDSLHFGKFSSPLDSTVDTKMWLNTTYGSLTIGNGTFNTQHWNRLSVEGSVSASGAVTASSLIIDPDGSYKGSIKAYKYLPGSTGNLNVETDVSASGNVYARSGSFDGTISGSQLYSSNNVIGQQLRLTNASSGIYGNNDLKLVFSADDNIHYKNSRFLNSVTASGALQVNSGVVDFNNLPKATNTLGAGTSTSTGQLFTVSGSQLPFSGSVSELNAVSGALFVMIKQ